MLDKDMVLEIKKTSEDLERFSLSDCINVQGSTLLNKVTPFSKTFRSMRASGLALYSREIMGPCKNRTLVRDIYTETIKEMVMMGSNNYLGLTTHPKVCRAAIESVEHYGIGMGGPPILNGMSTLHRELELALAKMKGKKNYKEYDAMLFGSGFQANLGWLKALLSQQDVLLYDELSHASLYDGIAQINHTHRNKITTTRFRHNDCAHLEALLKHHKSQNNHQMYVTVEGVYSMDGDLAPLNKISSLCEKYQAVLVIDDAHGTGVLGEFGGGTAEYFDVDHKIDISMGTFSKAFGVTGGFLVAKTEVIDYLRFYARSYMFSAHLPIATVAAILAGIEVIQQEPHLRVQLHSNVTYLSRRLSELGFNVKNQSAILPVLIPKEFDIRAINYRLHEEGVFLNVIEYPAVPKNQQRLRISLMATHTQEDLDFVIAAFKKIKKEFGL